MKSPLKSRTMEWEYIPGSNIQAPLSVSGDYVISHRSQQYTVSYRPPNTHVHIGTGRFLAEACELAEQHKESLNASRPS